MVLKKVLHMLKRSARQPQRPQRSKGKWAHWVGRNLAHLHYAVTVEPTWLEVNRLEIPIAGLPSAFDGLRIVQMSDFHGSAHITSAYLQEAVDLAYQQKPDLIALTGDFIHKGEHHIGRVAQVLGGLRASLGTFAVLGNHDFSVRNALGIRRYPDLHRKVEDALVRHGIQVMRNKTISLQRDEQKLFLTGVEDLWSRVCDPEASLAGLCPQTPRIVLAHNPLTIEQLNGHRCDLMLSGHTHGGQVMLPGLGRLALGPHGRRFAAGLYEVGSGYLYVNKGIGFGLRIRYRVRPEVAVFTLVKKGDATS